MLVKKDSLPARLLYRVLLLSAISIIMIVLAGGAGVVVTLLVAQRELNRVNSEVSKYDQFILEIESDLSAVSDSVSYTENLNPAFRDILQRHPAIFEVMLLDPQGQVLIHRQRVGISDLEVVEQQDWLANVRAGKTYISPVDITKYGVPSIDLAVPVIDESDVFASTLLARVDLTALWNQVIGIRVGENGYGYLTDQTGQILAYSNLELVREKAILQDITGRTPSEIGQGNVLGIMSVYRGMNDQWVIGTSQQQSLVPWFSVVEQPLSEILRDIVPVFVVLLVGLILSIGLVINLARFMRSQVAIPLGEIHKSVQILGSGDLTHRLKPQGIRELGLLAEMLNRMAADILHSRASLEEANLTLETRVTERTRDLQTAAEVSKQITTILDIEELLRDVVTLTTQNFKLYAAFIFSWDQSNQMLRLSAGTRSGAESALDAQVHNISIEARPSLVALAARTRKAVVVGDVTKAPDFMPTDFLPSTRSEVAIPMLLGDRLLGVFDMQSEIPQHFGQDELRVLTAMAEQVAIAIRNAQLFAETKAARQEAERANSIKSQFLAAMSHELRTPLNSILNLSKLVAEGLFGPVSDKQVDMLNRVVGSGVHLLSLINDLLDISKIEAGSLQLFIEDQVDLNRELQAVAATAESLLKDKPVKFIVEIEPDLPELRADRRRVHQIMLNIVSNACKFTQEGSITMRAGRQDDEVLVMVKDTGPGIAPEEHAAVFEIFNQAKAGLEHGGGTGLGMPISKRLAEAHGGRLWLESVPGQGATFYVSLPIQCEAVTPVVVS